MDKNSSPAYRRAVQDIAAKFLRVSLVTHPVPANWGGDFPAALWLPWCPEALRLQRTAVPRTSHSLSLFREPSGRVEWGGTPVSPL